METSLLSSLTKGKLIIRIPLALPRNESAKRPTGKGPTGYILRATFSIRFSRQGVDSSILNDPLQLKRYIGTIPVGSFCAHSAGRFDTFIRRCIRSIFGVSRGTLIGKKGCAPLPPIREENSKGQPLSSFSPGCPEENVG